MYKVVGLAGTSASGKDSGANHVAGELGYMHVSTSEFVRAEALRLHGSDDQYLLRRIAHEMRQEHGNGALAKLALKSYEQVADDYEGVFVSGYRVPEAAQVIREAAGVLVFTDAPFELRYKLLRKRARGGESRSFEEFIRFEGAEMAGMTETGQNLAAVRDMSDILIVNDSTEMAYWQKLHTAVRGEVEIVPVARGISA